MSTERSFDDLEASLRRGDKDAATEVFNRYVQRLVALARTRLDTRIRAKEDPEDVVQSVFRSFFARHAEGQIEIDNWDSLWAMLALITLRKCGNRIEYYKAGRRNVATEFRADESQESRVSWEALARDPSPSQAVVLAETLEELMRGLDELERTILSLRLQGFRIPEISGRVGRSERSVRRVLEMVKRRMLRMQESQP